MTIQAHFNLSAIAMLPITGAGFYAGHTSDAEFSIVRTICNSSTPLDSMTESELRLFDADLSVRFMSKIELTPEQKIEAMYIHAQNHSHGFDFNKQTAVGAVAAFRKSLKGNVRRRKAFKALTDQAFNVALAGGCHISLVECAMRVIEDIRSKQAVESWTFDRKFAAKSLSGTVVTIPDQVFNDQKAFDGKEFPIYNQHGFKCKAILLGEEYGLSTPGVGDPVVRII